MDDTAGPAPETVRVLYIAGWARSGSTLLGNLLGQADGCFFAGEVRFLVGKVWKENRLCGCGKPVRTCEVWSEVLSNFERRVGQRGLSLLESSPDNLKTRSVLRELPFLRGRTSSRHEREILPILRVLYEEISTKSRASLIVDTSKAPMYSRLLKEIPGIDLDIVHLVRDPRATAFSLKRMKFDPSGGRYMTRAGLVKNALMWAIWNLGAEWQRNASPSSANYIRIRYEDLARDPEKTLQTIAEFAGLPGVLPRVSGDGTVDLSVNHSAMGNPNRMESGVISIKTDLEWAREMPWRHKAVTALLTWPLLYRYGYDSLA